MYMTLADAALKGFVLLAAIALLALTLRRASAARRHLVWTLGVMGLLILPLLSAALPAWRVHVLPQWLAAAPSESSAPVAIQPAAARPVAETPVAPAIPVVEVSPIEPPPAESTVAKPAAAIPAPQPVAWRAWLSWLVPLWAVGALIALLPTLAGLWQLARLRRNSTPLTDAMWLALLDKSGAELKVRRPVRLFSSEAAAMPLTFGAWRPVLLVPADAATWPPERRRLVLLHELAHIRRWDWLTQMLAHAACAVHWFNPLAWLAARRMQIEREQACDDLVLACGAKASDYAKELLAIAANQHDRPLLALAAVPMARRSALEERLRAVLDAKRNRAALTAVTSVVALLLLAAVLVPLAMLQAAGPKPPPEPPATKPDAPTKPDPAPKPVKEAKPVVPRDPTPEEVAAREKGIRISVLNQKGDQGIPEFRVIAGVPARGIADEYEKRTGRTVVGWQPHTLRVGKDGDHVWPLDKAYDEMALRVEADGYVPQTALWLKKAAGPQHIVFMLAKDPSIQGQVLQPDGQPAVGATVALAMVQRDAVWEEGRLRGSDKPLPEEPADRWRLPIFVKTDAEGRFQLPTEPDPAALLIVHDSGVRELTFDEFQKSPEIKLQAWGRIEGRVLWKDKAGADEPLTLSIHRDVYGYPGMVASYAKTQSDAEGRFVIDKVLPGLVQLSRPIPISPTDPNAGAWNFDGLIQHVQVKAGEPTAVVFGGQGRQVTGKLTGRASWENVTFHFHPNAPRVGFGGEDTAWKVFAEFQKSPKGPLFFRDKQPVNADGTFTIENMLPGHYQIFFSAPGAGQHLAYTKITVEPEVAGQAPKPQGLGEIPVKEPAMPPQADKPAAAVPPADLDAFLERVRKSQRGPFAGNPIAKNEQGEIVGLSLGEFELRPGDGRVIGQITKLTRLDVRRSNVTDEDLKQWTALKNLTKLNLWDAKVSDAGIAALSELTSLQSLELGETGITDAGLASIAKLTALRELDLARTKITDAGLKSLSPLTKLEGLKLAETAVSDAGLAALEKLPALRGVTLDETGVTAAGLTEFAKRPGFGWMATEKLVAQELADRMTAGDAAGVEAMLSIGPDLPHAGTFKTRSVAAHPVTARDTEEQRTRFRIEWDWNNNGKKEGLFAEVAVRQGTVQVIEVGVLEAEAKAAPAAKPPAKTVSIRGTVVDDETGKPVAPLIVQGGHFEQADPTKVTWGYTENRSSAMDGSYSTTIRWGDGWTARILADGYLPQPILTKAPPEDQGEIEVLIRLKRGRLVRGQVLDHKDQPVKGAAVFAIGPTGVNLSGGKAWNTWGGDDNVPKPTMTDDKGRFELPAGDAKKLAVSGSTIDGWPADIAAEGDTIVRLPEAAKVEIQLDIEGADKESNVFLQLLVSRMPGFEGLRLERTLPIANGGQLTLSALPPGKYQFCRTVTNNLGMIGTGAMLEREFLELKPGETRKINYVRAKGARVSGKLTLPAEKLMGIVVQINSEKAEQDPFDKHEWTTTYASQTAAADGSFLTERIAPGTYVLKADAYIPLTPEQQVRSGVIGPTYSASAKIEVPESGALVVPELKLEPIR